MQLRQHSLNQQINQAGVLFFFSAIVTGFICVLLQIGGVSVSFATTAFTWLVMLSFVCAGQVLLVASRSYGGEAALAMSLVVGFVAITLPTVAITLLFQWSALKVMLPLAMGACLVRLRVPLPATSGFGMQWMAVAILGVTIVLMARIPISSPQYLLTQGVLPIWNDYYIHAATISSFGSPFSWATDMEVVGLPRTFYHYAAFMLPAALQTITQGDGLTLSTTVLMPFGLLVGGLGLYALATGLGGTRCALLALMAIICLPAGLGIVDTGWFDFYWLLLISPGAGYAIGVSAVAVAVLLQYFDRNEARLLWFAGLLLVSLIFVRVHMFMLLAPALIGAVILHRFAQYRRRILIGVLVSLGIFTSALALSTTLYDQWLVYSQPDVYLSNSMAGTHVKGLEVPANSSAFYKMFMQLLIVMVSVLGYYAVLFPLSLWFKVRRVGLESIDWLVPLMVMAFILLMLFSTMPSNGDITEFKHRHFVLLHALVVIFTVSNICKVIWTRANTCVGLAGTMVACVIALVVTVLVNWNSNPAAPNFKVMEWSRAYHMQKLTPGVLSAAKHLLMNSEQGDVFAIDASYIGANLNAPVIELIALSGVPSYVARPDLRSRRSNCLKMEITHRVAVLGSLSQADDWNAVSNIMQEQGIRWYLVLDGNRPRWDLNLKFASFRGEGIAIYDNGPSLQRNRLRIVC